MTDAEATQGHIIALTRAAIDSMSLRSAVAHAGAGAIVMFEGVVRDHSRGHAVRALEYEAYEEMAEAQMRAIAMELRARWGIERVAMVHRLGRLEVGEVAVVIAVASAHRGEAFAACQFAIDTLKATVPIWKKEFGPDGAEWVDG